MPAGRTARNVLSWLESSVEKAASAAEEHEALRAEIRALKATLEDKFRLACVKVLTYPLLINCVVCIIASDKAQCPVETPNQLTREFSILRAKHAMIPLVLIIC